MSGVNGGGGGGGGAGCAALCLALDGDAGPCVCGTADCASGARWQGVLGLGLRVVVGAGRWRSLEERCGFDSSVGELRMGGGGSGVGWGGGDGFVSRLCAVDCSVMK